MKQISLFIVAFIFMTLAIRFSKPSEVNPDEELVMENLEALANTEGVNPGDRLRCFDNISNSGWATPTFVTYCGTCNPIICKSASKETTCTYN